MRLKNLTWGTSDWRVLPLCLMHACFIQHRFATFCLVLQQRGSTAREATVVVLLWQAFPAFVLLASDERLSRFSLRVERVEFQLKPLFTGLTCINRTAVFCVCFPCWFHELFPKRKNWNPLTWEPVIALATAVRDLNNWPSYSNPLLTISTRIGRPL